MGCGDSRLYVHFVGSGAVEGNLVVEVYGKAAEGVTGGGWHDELLEVEEVVDAEVVVGEGWDEADAFPKLND